MVEMPGTGWVGWDVMERNLRGEFTGPSGLGGRKTLV